MSCNKNIEVGKSTCPESQADSGISEEPTVEKEASPQAGSSVPKRCSEVSQEEPPRKKLEASRAVDRNWIRFRELLQAVENDDASAVQVILRSDRSLIDLKDTIYGRTPLHHAARRECVEVVKELLAAGAKTSLKDNRENSPLHLAALGDVEIVKTLLAAGANTCCQDYLGRTPLHVALKWGSEDIAELITNYDAQNSLPDRDGYTPLHFAALRRRAGVVKKLLAAGANTRYLECRHRTPLHIALQFEAENIAELISDVDPENSLQDYEGCTPLHRAAKQGYIGVVRKLLAAGVSTRLQDKRGCTPLHCAVEHGSIEVVQLIHDADPENSLQDESGNTPLHLAAMRGYADVARKLLFSEAHPHLINNKGDSPLAIALSSERRDIMKLMVATCALRDIAVDWRNLPGWRDDKQYCMKLVADCEEEIQQMKETKVHNSTVSYYDVAGKHERKVAEYLRNDDVRNTLLEGNTLQCFPNYAEFITFKVGKAETRSILNEQCFKRFAFLSRLPSLPLICVENVLTHLKELEMQNFIKAFSGVY